MLDEPLSALDANLVVRMQGVLSRLQKELGITFVYVTHSQSEAFAMADRVVIMSQDRIEQVGTPREVFRQPATRFVAEFVGSNNILSGRVIGVSSPDLVVETSIGSVLAQQSSGEKYAPGDEVELVVSSDRLNIGGQDSDNTFQCRIVSEEFVGAIVSLLVEAENGHELKIQKQQKDLDALDLRAGQVMDVSWPRVAVYIIPRT